MKTTGNRSLILYVLSIAFAAGLLFFLGEYILQGGQWAVQPFNRHISGGVSMTGQVLDRTGQVLSSSDENGRVYNQDASIRQATLHAVGDDAGYISSAAQYRYRSELAGYNLFTGLGSPFGNRTGSDVTLTLDAELCKTAYTAMNGKKGAVLLCNYETGEILCMVSTPTFDPANPPEDLLDNPEKYDGVYLNNALSGLYTPGSTFKIITSAAAIENIPDLESRRFQCNGSEIINGNKITCTAVHGDQSFQDALGNSCNIAFGELAVEVGEEAMMEKAQEMGFGQSYSVDGVSTAKSVYNVKGASEDALAWSGIGQYTDQVNPYHMLRIMCAIANDGTPVEPYTTKEITTSFGMTTYQGKTSYGEPLLSASTASKLKEAMRSNIRDYYGEGLFPGMQVCAKTGTGEVGEGKEPTGWIVGFSADTNTPFAFVAVVEEGGYGISSAGPVASAVMQQAVQKYGK